MRFLRLMLVVLLLCLGLSAQAQVQLHSTTWTGGAFGSAVTGGPGTTTGAGDGWIDYAGAVASVTGANKLHLVGAATNQQGEQLCLRPLSENCLNQKEVITFAATAAQNHIAALRVNTQNGQFYQLTCTPTSMACNKYYAPNGLGAVPATGQQNMTTGTTQNFTAATVTDTMTLTVSISGTTTVTIVATLVDTTTTATLATQTFTDTSPSISMQSSNQMGLLAPTGLNGDFQSVVTSTTDATAVATTYSLSASPNGVMTNAPMTLTATLTGNTFAAGATITFTQTGTATGSFSGGVNTDTIGTTKPSAVVTYTPTSTGTLIFGATNSSTLTDPAALNITSVVILPTSAAAHWSPGNWASDTGQTGALYRVNALMGGYVTFVWSETAANSIALLNCSTPLIGFNCSISYMLDGLFYDNIPLPTYGAISIPVVGTGTHTLKVWHRFDAQNNRWNESGNVLKINNLVLDSTATPGTAPSNGSWIMIFGDSITEGVGPNSNLQDYSFLTGQFFLNQGYDYCIKACASQGWLLTGDGITHDVPAWYLVSGSSAGAGGVYTDASSAWNKVDSVVSLLDSNSHLSGWGSTGQEPAMIYSQMGVNDAANGSGGLGSGATATATVTAMAVTSIAVTAGGTNYVIAPNVIFTGGGGSGATATATVNSSGVITSVAVTSGGSGYTSAPAITFGGGGQSDLVASVTQFCVAARAAAPNAWIVIGIPYGWGNAVYASAGKIYTAAVKLGVTNYQSAHPTDSKVVVADFGSSVANFVASATGTGVATSSVHFGTYGHAYLAPITVQKLWGLLNASVPPRRTIH